MCPGGILPNQYSFFRDFLMRIKLYVWNLRRQVNSNPYSSRLEAIY